MRYSLTLASGGVLLLALVPLLPGSLTTLLIYGSAALFAAAGILGLEERGLSVRELSLVAALSTASAASRIPFAAIPSVQPSTFIILVSGAVFGPTIGFAVGILTPLISDLFLGMGPWLPWQMIAWGLLGLLAGMFFRGDRGLLLFGLIAGFLYGLITNLSMLSLYYPLAWRSLLLLEVYSFPFDLAHSLGNVAFLAVLGGRARRALSRFRTKVTFRVLRGSSPEAGGAPQRSL